MLKDLGVTRSSTFEALGCLKRELNMLAFSLKPAQRAQARSVLIYLLAYCLMGYMTLNGLTGFIAQIPSCKYEGYGM